MALDVEDGWKGEGPRDLACRDCGYRSLIGCMPTYSRRSPTGDELGQSQNSVRMTLDGRDCQYSTHTTDCSNDMAFLMSTTNVYLCAPVSSLGVGPRVHEGGLWGW